ncbi:MAG: hypothetical protein GY913_28465 [Proteobacteria bacterium]|nr:hypothetical protein [Pseudomonadota bacterium]MCP4920846.1 hypothetical protein [Pseudomonadota bacterium]
MAGLKTPDSTVRKIDAQGVGNCVFSAGELLYEKESTCVIEESFSTSKPIVNIRCYYPNQIQDYFARGAFYNQLRDDYEYWSYLTVEVPDGGRTGREVLGTHEPDQQVQTWDQQRIKFGEVGGCHKQDGKCVEIDSHVRALAKEEKKPLPYTAEVCFSFYFKWTDTYEEQWDDFSERIKKVRTHVEQTKMAKGCAMYTAE